MFFCPCAAQVAVPTKKPASRDDCRFNYNRACPFSFKYWNPLFTPLVEPVEVFTVPEQRVLRLKYPVTLIREDDKLRRDAHHLCGVECCHTLIIRDAEVHATVDAENRGVPFSYIVGRAVGVMSYCSWVCAPR